MIGEYAEMMLDGTCCEACGVFLDDEPMGFPGYCSKECAEDRGAVSHGEGTTEPHVTIDLPKNPNTLRRSGIPKGQRVHELTEQGYTYRQISKVFRCSIHSVKRSCKRYRREVRKAESA